MRPYIVSSDDRQSSDEKECAIEVDVRGIRWTSSRSEDVQIGPLADRDNDQCGSKQPAYVC